MAVRFYSIFLPLMFSLTSPLLFSDSGCLCSSFNKPLVDTKGSDSEALHQHHWLPLQSLLWAIVTLEMLPISLCSTKVFKFPAGLPLSGILCFSVDVGIGSSSPRRNVVARLWTLHKQGAWPRRLWCAGVRGRGVEAERTAAALPLVSLHNTDYNPEI